jgi:hypothetical protein
MGAHRTQIIAATAIGIRETGLLAGMLTRTSRGNAPSGLQERIQVPPADRHGARDDLDGR